MRSFLSAIILYFLFTLLFTYPAVHQLSDKVIGDGGDNYQFLAFQYLAKMQFDRGQLPFGWMNYWRYPVGFEYTNSYDSAFLLTTGIALYQFSTDPVVVYNLTILIFLVLNASFSYLFFKEATNSGILGFVGGLIYGFSFYNLARTGGHPNLLLTGVFPLFLYALIMLRKRNGDNLSLIVLTLGIMMIYLSSLQHLLLLLGAGLFFLPLMLIFYKDIVREYLQLIWRKKEAFLYIFLINLAVFMFFNYAKVTAIFGNTLILPGAELVSAPLINFFYPNKYLRLVIAPNGNGTQEWIEYAVFFGFLEVVLFLVFIFRTEVGKKFKALLLLLLAMYFILSLGDGGNPQLPLPYPLLFNIMPFRGIIEASRFYIFVYLILTLGILYAIKKYLPVIGLWGIILISFIFALERLPANYYLSSTLKGEKFVQYVKDSDAQGVLDLPLFPEWWNGNLYDMYSLYYQKPIVNGYIHWSGLTPESKLLTDKLHRFECNLDPEFVPVILSEDEISMENAENRKIVPTLLGYGITTIVFHKDFSLEKKECREAVQRIRILLESSDLNLENIYEDRSKAVYRMP